MPPPARTNAQEAATRVYSQGGILVRMDPYAPAKDRKGQDFVRTEWHTGLEASTFAPRKMEVTMAAPSAALDPLARFRQKVIERGGSAGIHVLGRVFRLYDEDRSQKLSKEELKRGLDHYGLQMSESDMSELLASIDKDKSGKLTFTELLEAMRGPLNARRLELIDMAFKVMDKNGSGTITIEDVKASFNTKFDADVLAGRMTSDEALSNFLSQFDTLESDGKVTIPEFREYYKNVSASIDNDDYFELMIRNAWHIPGGEGWSQNTANKRLLVVFTDGSQKVVRLEKDLGLDLHNHDAVIAALHAQGVQDIAKINLSGEV
eukprot:CAMPEP_0178414394 /NCGR_PEP_ID=MMETSP0689_2-20121128/23013_1 /TAXON_ID=160604 /ORGANISM="Amphidinium massartii, Strain CS-259" /LENGTH=319 /DNA_ID=CAMNT_0020035681 /DNA_START=138 /DNA_END=1097 /DNA_ORIENTATION=-